jgi:DNA-binding CsgD family transcriptional regulator/tetratricopeptide (TPR) repeat protein
MPATATAEPRLWGRHSECRRLDTLIENARKGTSGTLVVRGEAGIGKSVLLDYLLSHAGGCRLVRVAGVESEMELAFAALHQLCGPFLRELGRLPEPQRVALAIAFGLEDGPPPDRFLVGLATLTLLADVAEAQPLVCLVDDVQWLDRASAQVLGFVARRLAAEAVVVIFAVREPWETTDLAGLAEMAVGPLRDVDAHALLAAAIPGRVDLPVRERIVAEAHGNPLALLELPRAWTPAALAGGFGLPDGGTVSAKIEEGYRRRLAPLPEATRKLLLLAAADPVGDPRVIQAAADELGIPSNAAEPAATAGLIDDPAEVRFRHPMVRTVVYHDGALADRRAVHASLAKATDPAADPDRRAWHLAAAAVGPDESVALELERSAGRAQSRGGVAAAATFLQRAADLTGDSAQRVERLLAAADASFIAGALDAVQRLVATLETYPLDAFQRARIALLRGQVALVLGYGSDAPPLLLDAARQLEPLDPELARRAYLMAYGSAYAAAHLAPAGVLLEICRGAEGLPAAPNPPPLDLLLEGLARMHTDGRAVAIPILQRAARALTGLSPEDVVRWGWLAAAAGDVVWDSDAYITIGERQVQIVRDAGALAHLPVHLSIVAQGRVRHGEFADAQVLAAESDSVAAATGSGLPPFTALRLLPLQGNEPEASALIESTIAMGNAGGAGLAVRIAQWSAAILSNSLGRYEEAAAAARQVSATDTDPYPSMWALPELVEAAVRSGDVGSAQKAVERLAETTEPAGTDYGLGMLARSRALLAPDETAEAFYREGIERLGRTRVRPDLARAQLLYGEWLRRKGRRIDAREALRTAYNEFVSIGMEAFAERARRELVATGETVHKRSVDARNELTPQELQIARLASEGLTNPEIAAQLFLSRRTVEWHLRKVFDKLEITSRRELGVALGRLGRPSKRS